MKMRRRYLPLAAVLGVAAAVLPAIASSETTPMIEAVNEPATVYTAEHHRWSPTQVAVMAGGVVTFSNATEVPHGVNWVGGPVKPNCEEGAGKVPVGTTPAASGAKWSGACTFSQAGTYTFYCTVHGPEMTGTVTVSAGGTTTTTTTTPSTTTTTTGPTPAPGVESPFAHAPSLGFVQRHGLVKGSLDISKAGAGERLEIDLFAQSASLAKAKHSARVRVGRFVRSSVRAGKLSFTVVLNARARHALKRHRRLALSVKITLTPLYGEALTVTRSVVEHG
jgi:plastocyanin